MQQNQRLIFRASANGFSAAAFHRCCDGIASIFVIAKGLIGGISGGFANVTFAKSNRKGGDIYSERSFSFSLSSEPAAFNKDEFRSI